MKKIVLILVLALAGGGYCVAQNNNNKGGDGDHDADDIATYPSSHSLGVSIGFGHSYITGNKNWMYDPSWNFGIIGVYSTGKHLGFGYDVRYSIEGSKQSYESGDRITRLQYIRIPLRGIWFFNTPNDDFRPKFTLGPSLGFLVKGHDDFGTETYPFDFGVNASAGFNYRLIRGTWLNVDLNYYQGVLDVRKNTGRQEYNGNLGLDVGVAFGI